MRAAFAHSVFFLLVLLASSAEPQSQCELFQMQALATGKEADCTTCHAPVSAKAPRQPIAEIALIDFLADPAVQKRIELTKSQLESFKSLRNDLRSSPLAGSATNRAELNKKIEADLIPIQLQLIRRIRFNQMVARYGFSWTISHQPFVQNVRTTKLQASKLTDLKIEAAEEVEAATARIEKEYRTKQLKMLSPSQQKIVRQLEGEKVDLSAMQKLSKLHPTKLDLLCDSSIRDQVEMSREQSTSLEKIFRNLKQQFEEVKLEEGNIHAQISINRYKELRTETDKDLEKVLLKHQRSKLEKIQFAWYENAFGFKVAIGVSPFRERIKPTEKQLRRIQELEEEKRKQISQKSEDIRQQFKAKMLKELDRKQRDVIKELEGESDKPKVTRL